MTLAPMSTTATFWSLPPLGRLCTTRPSAACCAKDSTSITSALRPADSATATRSSTFSLRVAAIRTSCSSGLFGAGPSDLEIEVHFLERERDVLVRLALDLHLELFLAQARTEHDLLRDHRTRRHGHGDVLGAGRQALVRAAHRFGHGFEVVDIAVDDGIARQRLDGVALDAIGAFAARPRSRASSPRRS